MSDEEYYLPPDMHAIISLTAVTLRERAELLRRRHLRPPDQSWGVQQSTSPVAHDSHASHTENTSVGAYHDAVSPVVIGARRAPLEKHHPPRSSSPRRARKGLLPSRPGGAAGPRGPVPGWDELKRGRQLRGRMQGHARALRSNSGGQCSSAPLRQASDAHQSDPSTHLDDAGALGGVSGHAFDPHVAGGRPGGVENCLGAHGKSGPCIRSGGMQYTRSCVAKATGGGAHLNKNAPSASSATAPSSSPRP